MMALRSVGDSLVRLAAALVISGALAACAVDRTADPNAAALNVVPGSNEDFVVNVGRRTFFSENSTEISAEARVTLDKQAEWLSRYTAYKVKIEGFADEAGTAEHNKAVGLKRAEAVRAYLSSRGIAEERMRVKTFGNARERMVNTCGDTSCRSQNRRVVTVLDTEVGT